LYNINDKKYYNELGIKNYYIGHCNRLLDAAVLTVGSKFNGSQRYEELFMHTHCSHEQCTLSWEAVEALNLSTIIYVYRLFTTILITFCEVIFCKNNFLVKPNEDLNLEWYF
jgi:hypothetical protein